MITDYQLQFGKSYSFINEKYIDNFIPLFRGDIRTRPAKGLWDHPRRERTMYGVWIAPSSAHTINVVSSYSMNTRKAWKLHE